MVQFPAGAIFYTIQPYDSINLLAQRYNTTVYGIAAVNPRVDLNYLRIGQTICICPDYKYYPQNYRPTVLGVSKTEVDLMNVLKMLWKQHVVWTRLVILSMVFGLPDVDLVTNRLLQNPKDFEAALIPFYGVKIASEFSKLLTEHLVIAAELINAAKLGDNKQAVEAEKKWYGNADEIAVFLGSINPYWSEDVWRTMLYEHLAMTKAEAVDIIAKDYAAGISEYDRIERQAVKMADVMAEGIIKQFPEKFTI